MIQAGFFAAFNYIANNRWAQIVVGLGVGYLALQLYARHNRKVGEARLKIRVEKAQIRANEEAREAVETIKDETNERVERAELARASVPDGVTSDQLSDASKSILFRNDRASS